MVESLVEIGMYTIYRYSGDFDCPMEMRVSLSNPHYNHLLLNCNHSLFHIHCWSRHSGTLHGHVIALYVNGDTYIGGYLKNKRNGVGLYRYKDGAKYDGIFERDERHGRGIYTTKEGYAYDGTFVQGRFEGQGVRRSPNGSEQRGRFENWVYTE